METEFSSSNIKKTLTFSSHERCSCPNIKNILVFIKKRNPTLLVPSLPKKQILIFPEIQFSSSNIKKILYFFDRKLFLYSPKRKLFLYFQKRNFLPIIFKKNSSALHKKTFLIFLKKETCTFQPKS